MWPWEHAAVAYLLYLLGVHTVGDGPSEGREVLVLVVAAQGPDVIDKPLSWGLGVFPSGYAAGHSVLLAVPIGTLVLLAARRRGRVRLVAVAVFGYWSHLLADVLTPLRSGGSLAVGRVLWPLVTMPPYSRDLGLRRALVYLARFLGNLTTMDPTTAFIRYLALPLAVLVLWVLDGAPGVGTITRALGAVRRR